MNILSVVFDDVTLPVQWYFFFRIRSPYEKDLNYKRNNYKTLIQNYLKVDDEF